MSIRIFHQVGHCYNWNIESFTQEQCGDGLIWSPMHQKMSQVQGINLEVRKRSFFDPQYYLPNSPKAKLSTYPFFPDQITNGFSTVDFLLLALESAQQCVDFQLKQQFEGIVIPARFVDQMATKYFESQEELTVKPFLNALAAAGTSKPIYLTVPVTSAMLLDEGFQTQLLNWITGFSDISGVYVLVADNRPTKQIRSAEFLFAYLKFVHELANAGLPAIVGHLNTESILFSLIEGVTLTFGTFENTRMFSLDKFIDNEEERRGPKARIYLPALLNWVRYEQAMEIRNDFPDLWRDIYTPTEHSGQVIAAAVDPTFNQPGLYKHHFVCMADQIKGLGSLTVDLRFNEVRAAIKRARELHEKIQQLPLDLDSHGNGEHLEPWLNAINRFYRQYLKA